MLKNPFLLVSVAFGVSFSLSLVVKRDIKTAFLTGLITVPATFSGVVAVTSKQRTQQKLTLTDLEGQIYQLEGWETQLNQSLLALAAEKQRTETNINFLKTELSQLYVKNTEQRSYQQQLSQDLITFSEQRHRLEAESHELEIQIQKLEQRKGELDHCLRSIKAEKQDAETGLNSVQTELKQLQVQIAELQNQKQELESSLTLLNRLKPQMEERLHNLRNEIQALEESKAELNQSLSEIAQDKHITEASLNLLQSQLSQLQTQFLEQQNNKDKLGQELPLSKQTQVTEPKQLDKLPDEWTEFRLRLTTAEFQVIKAIIQQNEPSAAIKNIAEQNITMPEILIDSINKCALDTIGDLIIEPASLSSVAPVISDEYLTNVNNIIKTNEIN